MIGDRAADCEAAANAGVKGILLGGDCSSLLEAAAHIEASAAASEAVDDLISVLGQFRAMLPEALACGGMLAQALARGNKILTCGNGGSAAQALHLAEELVGRYNRDRDSLPAVCLSADATVLTCIGNDYGFEAIFSRQVAGLARPGDVLVLFSTSGNSNNLVGAVETAKNKGIASIAFLGKGGGKMRGLAQREIIVPGTATARVQEVHTLILHLLLERIDAQFC
jgi:D-sedoheptulose 7-phosphate isomerase